MDTSVTARYVAICALFAVTWVVAYGNFRVVVLALLRRKQSRLAKVAWPILGFLILYSVVAATRIEPDWVQLTQHRLFTSKMASGSAFRIAQLSDLHIEDSGKKRHNRAIGLVRDAKPDVIVLTGDYTNSDSKATLAELVFLGRRLVRIAPTYAIEGNWDSASDLAALAAGGVKLLRGWVVVESKRGCRIVLGEVDSVDNPVPPQKLPKTQRLYRVLATHFPNKLRYAQLNHIDLVLAGHTHGGQVRLPIFGAILPDRSLVGKYQMGFYRSGNTVMYVNRGVGMEGGAAPRVRLFCRPEVSLFDVTAR